ncbi:alkylated DNA repair protein alkB like protein 1 [Angomonas deanei]|nr:alkylated DNA repair protein alkB like protein 1 [Angomonas deanei]EPY41122.1 alkylated DNA repair protein alkB like protein 1 [Angomonas deanei]|eukprot:EPY26965.1 alkylated DNA repair protein alkB like protein 1 [Angomonas deanei]
MNREETCPNECRNGEKSELSYTPFRQVEKKYKLYQFSKREAKRRETPPTDFVDVVDFSNVESNTEANRNLIHKVVDKNGGTDRFTCFTFAGVPGLLVFPQVLTPEEQVHLCREAVLSYGDSSQHPNILSTHAKNPMATTCYQPPMRWSTLGFSYEWTSKTYNEGVYSPFPALIKDKMKGLMSLVEHVKQDSFALFPAAPGDAVETQHYEPQTAIVNYYPVGSMMMCHQDISEQVLTRPLMSISLGCSCIFLMGTNSREDTPYAFKLRSGDVVAFAGPSRTAFHSVPRILDDCPPYLTVADEDLTETERQSYDNHTYYKNASPDGSIVPVNKALLSEEERERYWRLCMKHMRVNINARQVFEKECAFLF